MKELRPRRARFVGMCHEFDHESTNAELREWAAAEGLDTDVALAYDGERFPTRFSSQVVATDAVVAHA